LSRTVRPGTDGPPLRRVLLVRLRRAGDVILTTPALTALRRALPESHLAYVVEAPFARLVEGHPALDETIVVESGQGPAGFLRLIRRLRRDRFDAVIDFHGGPRASRLTFLAGAPVRVGYEIPWRRWIYTVRVARRAEDGPVHSVVNHVNLVRALGLDVPEIPPLTLPKARPEEKSRVEAFIEKNGLSAAKFVVLHVGAGNEFRDWGAEAMTELVRLLSNRPGVRVVLAGGVEDRERAAEILRQAPGSALSVAGTFGWLELRELIGRATLFVGPDSGPMHVAAATPTSIVALFGPTLPAHFAPWRKDRVVILEQALDCRPCRQRECVQHDFRCLRTITPGEVMAAAAGFLSG